MCASKVCASAAVFLSTVLFFKSALSMTLLCVTGECIDAAMHGLCHLPEITEGPRGLVADAFIDGLERALELTAPQQRLATQVKTVSSSR
jgi:hypothetical protein